MSSQALILIAAVLVILALGAALYFTSGRMPQSRTGYEPPRGKTRTRTLVIVVCVIVIVVAVAAIVFLIMNGTWISALPLFVPFFFVFPMSLGRRSR